ncbi:hypothetical protein CRYUN_Cryun08bG0067500 [Craigia yunnanensis]
MTPQEYFNMKHSQVINCIKRCFGFLKARRTILREKSFYPVKIQCKIISACYFLRNFIRYEMPIDPIEESVGKVSSNQTMGEDEEENLIRHCETSNAWTEFRDKICSLVGWDQILKVSFSFF